MLVPLHAYYSRIVSSCRAPTFISKNLARQNLQLTFPLFLPHVFPANAKCKIARPNTPPLLNVCVCFGCMCATIILWNPTNTRKKDFAEIHFLKINKSNSTFIKYTFFFFQKIENNFFPCPLPRNSKRQVFFILLCIMSVFFGFCAATACCSRHLHCLSVVTIVSHQSECVRVCSGECLCLNERKWEEIYYFHPLVLRLSFFSFAFLSVGSEKKRGSPSLQKWLFGSVWVGWKLCVLVSSVVMLPLVSFCSDF